MASLTVGMAAICFLVAGCSIGLLYGAALSQTKAELLHIVRNRARLIEADFHFHSLSHADGAPGHARAMTLSSVAEAHKREPGFGRTGEFLVGTRQDNRMVCLLRQRTGASAAPRATFLGSGLAEPMRRALLGRSGVLRLSEPGCAQALAAYEPVRGVGWGIVAKVDLAEVQAPFVAAAIQAALLTLVAVGAACGLFGRVTAPVIRGLEEREQRFRATFEQAAVGIGHVALDGTWLRANQRLCDITGFRREELLQRSFSDVTHPDDHDAGLAWLGRLVADGARTHSFEQRLLRKDGSAVWVQLTVALVREAARVAPYLVIVAEDISERRAAEEALRRLHAELETRVQERTAALARANEALQREMAERERAQEREHAIVVEERTRIAREIHDTLAQGFTGVVVQLEAAEDALEEEPEAARAHILRARKLARDGLAEARRSVWALRPQALEQGDLPAAIAHLVHHLADDSRFRLEFACHGTPRPMDRDTEEHLLRICQEALTNALRYARAETIQVHLSFCGRQVVLRVQDDGVGFDTASASSNGGFGFRSMQERATQMGGQLSIASQPQAGTQVTVTVPVGPSGPKGEHHD